MSSDQEKPEILRKLYEEFELFAELWNRGIECRLGIKAFEKGICVTPLIIHQALAEMGIVEGIDEEAVERFCRQVNEVGSVHDVVVATGREPVEGREAKLEFHIQPSNKRPVLEKKEETGEEAKSVDFRAARRFENVEPGMKMATLHPGCKGTPGVTVRGTAVAPHPVRDTIKIRAGAGVEQQENEFVAKSMGRIVHEGGVLSITDEFVVSKDVDFDVGHVDFVGSVRVYGDVLDGFNVRGVKGVRVEKNVGVCTIESQGDIDLAGMTGRDGAGIIRCGGNLTARYLDNVQIECEGNISVKNEMMHSVVRCGGRVEVVGSLVGGECIALSGIEAGIIGSEGGVKTRLKSGIDFRYLDKITPLQEELKTCEDRSQKLLAQVGPYARRAKTGNLPDAIKERLTDMLQEVKTLKARHDEIEQILKDLQEEMAERSNPKINAVKRLFSGTVIGLGKTVEEVKQTINRGVSVVEFVGAKLCFVEYSRLSRKASEIQKRLLEEAKLAEQERRAQQAFDDD